LALKVSKQHAKELLTKLKH